MVYIAVSKSDMFPFRVGFCKSGFLSPVLFIIFMDWIPELWSEKARSLFLQMTLSYWHHQTVIFSLHWKCLKQNLEYTIQDWKSQGMQHEIVMVRNRGQSQNNVQYWLSSHELCEGWNCKQRQYGEVKPKDEQVEELSEGVQASGQNVSCMSPWGGVSGMSHQEDTQT